MITQIRSELPVLNECLYFNTGTMGPSPARVTQRFMDEYASWQAHGPGNPRHYHAMHRERLAPFRERLATTLGVSSSELALTANSTDGVNIVAWGHEWQDGDEVIIGDQEHPAVFVPWLHLQKLKGVRVRYLPYRENEDDFLAGLEQSITPRTRLVVLSHVSSQTGLVIPAERVTELCHAAGVEVMFDGAQAIGNVPVDIGALGCDYYTFNGHKWCLGPAGTGALFVREERLATLAPSWVGGGSTVAEYTDFETGAYRFQPNAQRYEFATRNWPLYLGWDAALELLESVGWEHSWSRSASLAQRLRKGVSELPGVELVGPRRPDRCSGLVSVRVHGQDAAAVVDRLIDDYSVVTRPVRELNAVRFSCAFFNLSAEVDQVLTAIAAIAIGS